MALTPPVEPMLARAADRLPGPQALPGGVVFEPKWDGYRMLVFARNGRVFLQSRNGTDLTTGFPEIAGAATALGRSEDLVLDGEAVIFTGGQLDFPALQRRIGARAAPAAALADRTPAHLVCFDVLERGGRELLAQPYRERRAVLEEVFTAHGLRAPWSLSPASDGRGQAEEWLEQWPAVGVEGLMVKGRGQRYEPGRRGWIKVRARETAEAVIGAVTGPAAAPETVLLGRYDTSGVLRLIARSTPLSRALRGRVGGVLRAAGAGHPWQDMRIASRWGSREALRFTCVAPEQVAEFQGDVAVDRGRYRHPVRLVRLRADMTVDELALFAP